MENTFLDAMMFRHATKEFNGAKMSDAEFNAILEMGRISPSSFGFEPWKFVVVQNEALREKIKTFAWGAQGQLPTASHFVIILARKNMKFDSDFITHMIQDVKQLPEDVEKMYREFYTNFQTTDFKLDTDRKIYDWAGKQTYIALANMMTGAATMGIDSCPIEGFDLDATEAFLKDDLGINTDEFGPSVMVAFGYRKDEPKREKARQALADITAIYN